ncbi:asparagine synthase (glutamine-hydrolyzing) [Loigolactobacillus coryniformis]|uniref:asparagine synthase (glutamine-hydrolyzing) n=1 Tax=Loigolactobacillus coryniformis subsp. torquens DSM 20004 = KCTC 3535 TaxID=1423822 RepID=A0A2D1KRZ9_9LACO|nr:asparagine synthase (glutamine-hydrolyzing) [Loigolactobacillus coryniformis]ATO44907.1 asparagine synthase (glutamine-hydrolyzing) [Loigolactobacillus coryniformis subsp. torquens DSM 20004 = KCTC 3535]KRK71388.1 asparagine synthase [Loigolactobacillus coryniformis subsp. torquens DSM 20004 = KCTC 3535]
MCGIIGFAGGDLSVDDKNLTLDKQVEVIKHRGPNDKGKYVDEDVALGFRRLSIIDLTNGKQPIYNADNTKLIVFNGEIYNYQSVRDDLEQNLGYVFKTHTDTEVLLHGYEAWGKDVLKRIRGMFTFFIWDTVKKELFGARDFFGIKPLYYTYLDDGTFMFSSELKTFMKHPGFKKQLNKDALKPYLMNQYNDLDETFFKGVFKFPAGHYFMWRDGHVDIEQYWDAEYKENNMSFDETVEAINKSVEESVKLHHIADVPVGSFLSEGVDSSYVTSVLKPEKVFSVGFDETYNEAGRAKVLADDLGLEFHTTTVHGDDAFAKFPLMQYHMDEPDGNPSLIPLWFLSEMAAKEVTVVLSGEGADEMFAGYVNYGMHSHNEVIKVFAEGLRKLPRGTRYRLANRIKKGRNFHGKVHLYTCLAKPSEFYVGESVIYTFEHPTIFSADEANNLVTAAYKNDLNVSDNYQRDFKKVKDADEVKQMQYIDLHHFMANDILQKADKISMAHSLELRVPFLDRDVAELANSIPSKYLLNTKDTKYAFRRASEKHLGKEFASRPKLGFPVPIHQWLLEDKYYQQVRELFSQDFVKEFFDQQQILSLLDETHADTRDGRRQVWVIYTFLVWYQDYFINLDQFQ